LNLKLLKLGALARICMRRVKIAFASDCAVTPNGGWPRRGSPGLAALPPDTRPPRRTGGITQGPRETKPRQPSRRASGSTMRWPAAERLKTRARTFPQGLRFEKSGIGLDYAALLLKRLFW
jgi:hypothetical protein